MNLVEQYRDESLKFLFANNSFKSNFNRWKKPIIKNIGKIKLDSDKLLILGDNLSKIFLTTSQSGRSQKTLSNAGCFEKVLFCFMARSL